MSHCSGLTQFWCCANNTDPCEQGTSGEVSLSGRSLVMSHSASQSPFYCWNAGNPNILLTSNIWNPSFLTARGKAILLRQKALLYSLKYIWKARQPSKWWQGCYINLYAQLYFQPFSLFRVYPRSQYIMTAHISNYYHLTTGLKVYQTSSVGPKAGCTHIRQIFHWKQ